MIPSIPGPKVTLGLDLQGGLHMLLSVKLEEAIKSKLNSIASSLKYHTTKNDILLESINVDDKVSFTLIDKDDEKKIDEFVKKLEGVVVKKDGLRIELSLTPQEATATKDYAINQAVEIIRNRLDMFGLSEPVVAKNGEDKILVQLPGVKSQAEEQRARELIAKSAKLEMMAVDENKIGKIKTDEEAKANSDILVQDYKNPQEKYLLKEIPILDGGLISDAKVGFDNNNQPIINFSLNSEGAAIFGDYTAKNVGTRLAIMMDGKVYSAPVIRERIGGGSGQISGNFTADEARDVAIALRSGALAAPIILLEKRSVGPSLGADSIKASMMALVTGALLVFIFMAVYYGRSGMVANIALLSNVVLIIAIMAIFGATLTLPGMAGIVLTIGISVDANVIINERIRELLRMGQSVKVAIENGYNNAFSTIMDANITTLIGCLALYSFGTGPIKGFALTISIGIIVSVLTAIVGTHGMFDAFIKKIEKDNDNSKWFGMEKKHGTI
jgi:preprotein translocase subunit SecD